MSLTKKNNISSILGEYKSNIYDKLKPKTPSNNLIRRNPSQTEKSYFLKNNNSQMDKLILLENNDKKRIIANNFEINKYEKNSSFSNNEYNKSVQQTESEKYSNSLSKILVDNAQYKGNLIKSMKNNLDDRMYKKKSYADMLLPKRNESLDIEADHKKNNSFAYNSNLYKQYRAHSVGRKNDTTWDIPCEISVQPKNEISFEDPNKGVKCNCQIIKLSSQDCEKHMDDLLRSIKYEKNESNYNVKQFSLYKKILDELGKIQPGFSKIVFRLTNGLTDVFQNLTNENKAMKEKCESYDIMLNKYSHLNKKYQESNRVIEEKNEEIKKLKEKFSELEKAKISEVSSPAIKSTQSNGRNDRIISEHDNNITNINIKLVEDLDALYFYDKIHMNRQTNTEVPPLDLNFEKKRSDSKTDLNVSIYDSNKKLSNGIINKYDTGKKNILSTADQIKLKLMTNTVKK